MRKQRAPPIRKEDWEPLREGLISLYIGHKFKIEEMERKIKEDYDVMASSVNFPPIFQSSRTFSVGKNVKTIAMKHVVKHRQRRKLVGGDQRKDVDTINGRWSATRRLGGG